MSAGTGTQALEEPHDDDTQATNVDDITSEDEDFSDEVWGELIRTSTSVLNVNGSVDDEPFKVALQGGSERRYVIGRDPKADVHINDPHVSSKHCVLFRDEHTKIVFIEDHSLSGTFVNGERVAKNTRKAIQNGDTISLLRPSHPQAAVAASSTPASSSSGRSTPSRKRSPAKPDDSHYHEFLFRSMEAMHKKIGPCKGSINVKYDILDVIGTGTFATVRKGINKVTGEEVAVKIVERKNFTFEPERWRDQLKEIEMLKRLDHSACVKLLDTYSTEDAIYIVMEFIKGGELFDRIVKGGRLTEANTQVAVRRILEAVAYLHGEGIVHRDLKPENILLLHKEPSCFHIKVADFGVARLVGGGCKTLTGSISYIAPEVLERRDTIEGTTTYDYGCDVWSIGVIAYVCLMAKLPFKSSVEDEHVVQDLKKATKQLLEFRGPEWKPIGAQAKDFLKNVFSIDPRTRLSAKQALEHPWISAAAIKGDGEECVLEYSQRTTQDSLSQEATDGDGTDAENMRKRKREIHPPVPIFSQEQK